MRNRLKLSRRSILGLAAATAPHIWLPKPAYAQQCGARGTVKHLVFVRLSGGFRFTTAFNADVAEQFNPFGLARNTAAGTEWGVSRLLEPSPWIEGNEGAEQLSLGMRGLTEFSNEMAVLATVDHEPNAGNADGGHGTGLQRFLTGTVAGDNSLFTMLHYGVRGRIAAAAAEGRVELPPFVLGSSGMAVGNGPYAAYRPPLLQSDSFESFALAGGEGLPAWAQQMAIEADVDYMARLHRASQPEIEAYIGSRESTKRFGEIFSSEILRTRNNSDELVDGISNRELGTIFGESQAARRLRLGLRLFHFGCPAVYLDQGGYDLHSNEDERLPGQLGELSRMLSGLNLSLKKMSHPSGGSYWDHTLVVLGSEFGRTARGSGFNSAGGSDHGGDRATRWMSMPMMGGIIDELGLGGKQLGSTAPADLTATGEVYSYRSVVKTLMDLLCADHSEFFPGDAPLARFS